LGSASCALSTLLFPLVCHSGHGEGLSVCLNEVLANRPTAQEWKAGSTPGCSQQGGELLTWTGDITGRWKEHFEELLNPDWQTGIVVPLFKKGDRRVCSNYCGITLLSLPGKVYARVLKRRLRPLVEPQIQDQQCGFRPGRGTVEQLFTLERILEGSWEFAQPVYMCFVDLEKAFDRVPQRLLWGVLREYGVPDSLLRLSVRLQ